MSDKTVGMRAKRGSSSRSGYMDRDRDGVEEEGYLNDCREVRHHLDLDKQFPFKVSPCQQRHLFKWLWY